MIIRYTDTVTYTALLMTVACIQGQNWLISGLCHPTSTLPTLPPPQKKKGGLMFAWSLFYVRIENFQNDDKICSILVTLITLTDLRVTCESWGKTINESCIVLIKMCIAFALLEVVCVSMQCLVELPPLSEVWLSMRVSFHTICMTWIFRSNHTFNTEGLGHFFVLFFG